MKKKEILIAILMIICSTGFGQVKLKKPVTTSKSIEIKKDPVDAEKLRRTVSGKVVKASGDLLQKITLQIFDLDLRGIGLYKDFKFAKQLWAANQGFEFLGETISNENGYYEVAYYDWMIAKSEHKRAGLMVFAIQGDNIIGRSALIQNAARYTRDVVIIIEGNIPNPADELLKLSLVKPDDRTLFVKIKTQYRGSDKNDFWENYLPQHSNFNANTINNLRQHQDLFLLSGCYIPLVKEIKNNDVGDLSRLVEWDATQWRSIIKKAGVPEFIEGKDKTEKENNYATYLQKRIATEFPTASLLHKISTNKVIIGDNKVRTVVSRFLTSEKGFDIKTSNIKQYEDKIAKMAGDNKKAVLVEMNALQRMVRINPDTSFIDMVKEKRCLPK